MTYQVLARKWRPRVFTDVIGQEHVNRTLQNSVLKKQIAHAYLLTGTRGVGKTTIARIFAKAIRCENLKADGNPCLECSACKSIDENSSLDYLEIDGASNTRVDNIRELIENVQYLPSSGEHKVYVIDEVHMLSVNAFNALLKTLEEPPAHVVFIFATTDPQKLLGTVLSRVQRFDFKNVAIDVLNAHVKKIALAENINFTSDDLITELSKHGKGSVRDTLSLLDQVLSLSEDRNINEDVLLMSLGLAKTKSLKLLLDSIVDGNKAGCIEAFKHVQDENVDLEKFVLQILDTFFNIIESLDTSKVTSETLIDTNLLEKVSTSELLWIYEVLAKDFEWAVKSIDPEKMIMFTLIKVSLRHEIMNTTSSTLEVKKKLTEEKSVEMHQQAAVQQLEPVELTAPIEPVLVQEASKVEKSWENFVKHVMSSHKAIAANLERGNLLGVINLETEVLYLEMGIAEDDKIFYEFIIDPDHKHRVNELLADFFEKDISKVKLKLTLLNAEEKEEKQFLSKADIVEKEYQDKLDQRRKNILENKFILEAESIFNRKVDKIIVNEK
jgi:DNA polymerase-3 subunit gamma/tau